jgi:hypothetical protein
MRGGGLPAHHRRQRRRTSVPGLFANIKALTGEQATQAISAAGILTNVPASHEVQIAHQIIGHRSAPGRGATCGSSRSRSADR